MDSTSLIDDLAGALAEGVRCRDDRIDHLRFPEWTLASRPGPSAAELAELLASLASYQAAADVLADRESRSLLAKLLAYRALGPEHIRLPLDPETYWSIHDAVAGTPSLEPTVNDGFGFDLGVYDLSSLGYDLTLRCHLLNVLDVFALHQYELRRPEAYVAAESGDVVIDGGAAWGDTALYFAERVGSSGRVVAIEFLAESQAVLNENLARNPRLAGRVELVGCALWNVSGETIGFSPNGPGSSVLFGAPQRSTNTTTIDDLVIERGLPRVDLIKLDIEGAERQALDGAESTIRTFMPKLAISAYHRPEDLYELPMWIDSLGLGYRCYLDHFTSHREETVLFALPPC